MSAAGIKPKPMPVKKTMPSWKLILHNDPVNKYEQVIGRIMEIVRLPKEDAEIKTAEAHDTGRSILLVAHKELLELKHEQFMSCRPPITTSIEQN